MFKKFALISLSSILLVGCGGGGSAPAPKVFSVSVISKPDVLAENDAGTVNVNIANAINAVTSELTVLSGDAITVSKTSNNAFNLQAKDTDRNRTVKLQLVVQDGTDTTRQYTTTFEVSVENTSFAADLAEITVVEAQQTRLLALDEEKRFLASLRDVATVLGEDAAKISSSIGAAEDVSAGLAQSFGALALDLAGYLDGNIGEVDLRNQYVGLRELLKVHASPYTAELNAFLMVLANDGKPPVQLTDLVVNTELETVSLVVGNNELGSVENGVWVYSPDFIYLDTLVSNADCAI